jgi:two-component system OmpR family response regulator
MRILLVEDDGQLGGFLEKALGEASHVVERARTLAVAREFLRDRPYDLVSMDVSLPDGSGLDMVREMRDGGSTTPILVLTSHGETSRRVEGLDSGADDYLIKPFALEEYLSRVRALLRRGGGRRDPVLRLGTVACDDAARRVTVDGREVNVTPKEFALLRLFLAAPGVVQSRTQVVHAVWRWTFDGYSNVVDVHVSSLRKKLKGGGIRFRSVPRVGYVLEAAVEGDAEDS